MLGGATGIHMISRWASQADSITPQPYFAGVKRALEALAKLGAIIQHGLAGRSRHRRCMPSLRHELRPYQWANLTETGNLRKNTIFLFHNWQRATFRYVCDGRAIFENKDLWFINAVDGR